ncbi:MAG: DUF2786 domain-containing protein [Antricoccus sp.]
MSDEPADEYEVGTGGRDSAREPIPPERFVQLAAMIAIAPAIAIWILLGAQSVWIRIVVIGVIAAAVAIAMIWGRPTPAELMQRHRKSEAIESLEQIWKAAVSRHDSVLADYYPYESDPVLLLRFPALTDVQQAPTAQFFDALHDAVALRTDELPSSAKFADDYVRTVRTLVRAWDGAKRHAHQIAATYLKESDARRVDRAAKLLAQAESSTEPHERAAYFAQARTLVNELRASGAVVLPPMAIAAIEAASRRAINS